MWTELLLHLGIILALLAVLYYVERRVSSIEVPQGISLQQFNAVIRGVIERQNDLACRYNKIDEYLTEFNKWATTDEADNQKVTDAEYESWATASAAHDSKVIEVADVDSEDPFLVPVSDDDSSDVSNTTEETDSESDANSETDDDGEFSEITYDEEPAHADIEATFELPDVYNDVVADTTGEHHNDEESAAAVGAPAPLKDEDTTKHIEVDIHPDAPLETDIKHLDTGSIVETVMTADLEGNTKDYNKMSVKKLKELAKERGIRGNIHQMSKQDLVHALTGATIINI